MSALEKTDPDAPKPWERLPKESSKAYAAFQLYRSMPPMRRSQRAAAKEMHRNPSLLADWSRKFRWMERADAFDMHQDAVALEAQDQKVRQLAEARADFALEAIVAAGKALRGDEEQQIVGLDLKRLSAKDIAALAGVAEKIGASLERANPDSDANRDVNVKLSFDITPNVGGRADDVIDGEIVVHAELPPAKEDE